MHVISRKKLREFCERHSDAGGPLDAWYTVVKHASWQNAAEVREHYPTADPVGKWTIFNVGGNRYRLVTEINYQSQTVFIRHVLTHQEYNRNRWKQQ